MVSKVDSNPGSIHGWFIAFSMKSFLHLTSFSWRVCHCLGNRRPDRPAEGIYLEDEPEPPDNAVASTVVLSKVIIGGGEGRQSSARHSLLTLGKLKVQLGPAVLSEGSPD